ncbi:MAG TPA: hypothetical protein VM487_04950 [Phycisphaerae bacterium]|nr:hypothetical protein [Phycisphaerae bacterium]
MARRGVQLILVCEDGEHERFARYALLEFGFQRHELRFFLSPSGRGAAEQWVRQRYADEVRAHRRKACYRQVGLVVVIDADGETVARRERRLANELRQSKQQERQARERIVHWIPRRHVETWVAFLRDQSVDERMDCKGLVDVRDYRPATKTFVEIYREPHRRPAGLLASITHALDETNRLVAQSS